MTPRTETPTPRTATRRRMEKLLSYKAVVAALDAATYGMPVPGAREVHVGRLWNELIDELATQDEARDAEPFR